MILICILILIFMSSIILNYFIDKIQEGLETRINSKEGNNDNQSKAEESKTEESNTEESKAEDQKTQEPKTPESNIKKEESVKEYNPLDDKLASYETADITNKLQQDSKDKKIQDKAKELQQIDQSNSLKREIYELIDEYKQLKNENLDKLANLSEKLKSTGRKFKSLKKQAENIGNASEMNEDMKKHYSIQRMGDPSISDSTIEYPTGINCQSYFTKDKVIIIPEPPKNKTEEEPVVEIEEYKRIFPSNKDLTNEEIEEQNKLIIKNDFQSVLNDWNKNIKNEYNQYLLTVKTSTDLIFSILNANIINKKLQ